MNRINALLIVCVYTVSMFFCLGCGNKGSLSGVYPAQGTVTLDGQPLLNASITLVPETLGTESRGASALSDDKGHFQLSTLKANDGAFPGTYQVIVVKKEVDNPLTDEEKALEAQGKKVRDIVAVNKLPKKYESSATTDLTLTIEASSKGNNSLALELTSH